MNWWVIPLALGCFYFPYLCYWLYGKWIDRGQGDLMLCPECHSCFWQIDNLSIHRHKREFAYSRIGSYTPVFTCGRCETQWTPMPKQTLLRLDKDGRKIPGKLPELSTARDINRMRRIGGDKWARKY